MTVALYLRLSSEDNDGKSESESISNQRNLLLHHIHSAPDFCGANVVEFCDDGWSGKNFDRPAVKELLERAKKGEIQCIMVKDLSRFGRDYITVGCGFWTEMAAHSEEVLFFGNFFLVWT